MKTLKSFLWARVSPLGGFNVFVQVDAHDKDEALKRLAEKWPTVDKSDWDFLEEVDPEHDVGRLGQRLKYPNYALTKPH